MGFGHQTFWHDHRDLIKAVGVIRVASLHPDQKLVRQGPIEDRTSTLWVATFETLAVTESITGLCIGRIHVSQK